MDTDLTFITNEKNQSLKERFEVVIKDTRFFDFSPLKENRPIWAFN